MGAARRRSKKRSGGKKDAPHRGFTLYLDENYNCEEVKERLTRANIRFKAGLFDGKPDSLFLPEIGRRKWILITTDKRIRYREIEKAAVVKSKVRLFVFTSGNMGHAAMADALVKAKTSMRNFCKTHESGFSASVHKSGKIELRMDHTGKLYGSSAH